MIKVSIGELRLLDLFINLYYHLQLEELEIQLLQIIKYRILRFKMIGSFLRLNNRYLYSCFSRNLELEIFVVYARNI